MTSKSFNKKAEVDDGSETDQNEANLVSSCSQPAEER
jgi:hypothetical protein